MDGVGLGLGVAATEDDEHAATASQAMSVMQRPMFHFYYTRGAIRFRYQAATERWLKKSQTS